MLAWTNEIVCLITDINTAPMHGLIADWTMNQADFVLLNHPNFGLRKALLKVLVTNEQTAERACWIPSQLSDEQDVNMCIIRQQHSFSQARVMHFPITLWALLPLLCSLKPFGSTSRIGSAHRTPSRFLTNEMKCKSDDMLFVPARKSTTIWLDPMTSA